MSAQRVTLTLAHPLRTKDAEELGLEPRVYQAGTQLNLLKREADRLAGAGLVLGADTNDRRTWATAMPLVKQAAPAATKPTTGKAE